MDIGIGKIIPTNFIPFGRDNFRIFRRHQSIKRTMIMLEGINRARRGRENGDKAVQRERN